LALCVQIDLYEMVEKVLYLSNGLKEPIVILGSTKKCKWNDLSKKVELKCVSK